MKFIFLVKLNQLIFGLTNYIQDIVNENSKLLHYRNHQAREEDY